jgi:hypothetical protein
VKEAALKLEYLNGGGSKGDIASIAVMLKM